MNDAMKYGALLVVAVVLVVAGLVLMSQQAPPVEPTPVPSQTPSGAPCATVADCPPGAARCVGGVCVAEDEHGCVTDGGYSWCEPLQKCIRPWEEECPSAIDAKAREFCGKENVANVYICGENIRVVSALLGGGSTFYTADGTLVATCPVVGPDSMSDECKTLLLGSNCVERDACPSSPGTGLANPAAVYCTNLGYTLDGEDCVFSAASRCEQWEFYHGTCGHTFSLCESDGFTLEPRTEEMDTWTAEYAVCNFGSSECLEQDYLSGSCTEGQCKKWSQAGGCEN